MPEASGGKDWLAPIRKLLGIEKRTSENIAPDHNKIAIPSPEPAIQVVEKTTTIAATSNLSVPVENNLAKRVEESPLDPVELVKRSMDELASSSEVVVVPAAEGNEEVRILPRPAYFTVDHGVNMVSFDDNFIDHRRRSSLSFYAAYLMRIGQRDELRFLTLPVALFPGRDTYNQQVSEEMAEQGFPQKMTREYAAYKRAHDLFGYLDLRYLPTIRFLFASRKFLTEDRHPEESGWVLHSGFGEKRSTYNLTILGDHSNFRDPRFFYEQGLYNLFDSSARERYSPSNVKVVSDPFNAGSVNDFEAQILDKALKANHAKV